MADLANEGRGGAVGGQLAARERAAGGRGATSPRGEHPGGRGTVCSGILAHRAPQPLPIASPQAGLAGPAHHSRQSRPCHRPSRGPGRPMEPWL